MKFKEGDIVKVISVSGHGDISKAIGLVGQVKHVWTGNLDRFPSSYPILVKYFIPLEYSYGTVLWVERFKEEELELAQLAPKELQGYLERSKMLESLYSSIYW